MAGSAEALLDTTSMYLACFCASQSVSTCFTSDLEMSSRTAVMAFDESEEDKRLRVPPVVMNSSFRHTFDGVPCREHAG